ncbi:restriction endonuclease subunit S [Aeromonas caviae]|uniref:restriction endonuclease subunit S n=1 Tax=Aeromonas caviae TaxID=648 RepID=UPI002B475BE2|nr:restriction endonuclease subunit S [Aeromonas caviae]
MILLPTEWVETALDNIADWGSGGTPSRKNEDYYGGDIPWFKTGDLGNKVIKKPSEFITELGLKNSSAKLFPKGAVAIAMYGATIGKTSILGIDATTNQACAVGNPKPNVTTSEFLYYFLLNEKDDFIAKGKGGAQPNISQALIKEHVAYLPSFAEQKEIVDRLDKLLAQVEATQARLARIPDIIKLFRQSVLAAAVSGKLTEEWGEGSSLWQKLTIDNLAQVKGGKRLPQGEELVEDDTGFPYIRAGQLKQGTVISNDDARTKQLYLTASAHAQISRYIVEENDVYLTIVGASIGDAGLIPPHYHGANLTENAAKITEFKQPISSKFLAYWLRSPALQGIIQLEIKSGAQGKLALKRIKELPVPYPELEEQTEIVRRVEQLFAYADTIEQQAKAAKERVDMLTQAILAKAFRGELTADWRAANPDLISGDNSASALLEKIKAERQAMKPNKKTAARKKF